MRRVMLLTVPDAPDRNPGRSPGNGLFLPIPPCASMMPMTHLLRREPDARAVRLIQAVFCAGIIHVAVRKSDRMDGVSIIAIL
ncbi:hypothetical protein Sfum_0085 [Syntrophobacter fumaroxidans MPOB]|uniref:Uncharacterized protein n=1 Tax=Syntrophobacter fumaroxidans (strain DSM 10017 / MPOB) TaxID=335543 RepID=A0LED6_SYNFM|nr:hypothetical protein Sfum_0085 [Syntrophobacter fumaroxidans MPOB]